MAAPGVLRGHPPQAIGVGLLYIVLWEGFFSGFVSGVRLLSIRHYAIALMHGMDARRFAGMSHVRLGVTIAMSAIVFAGFLALEVRRLRRMDIPPELVRSAHLE